MVTEWCLEKKVALKLRQYFFLFRNESTWRKPSLVRSNFPRKSWGRRGGERSVMCYRCLFLFPSRRRLTYDLPVPPVRVVVFGRVVPAAGCENIPSLIESKTRKTKNKADGEKISPPPPHPLLCVALLDNLSKGIGGGECFLKSWKIPQSE